MLATELIFVGDNLGSLKVAGVTVDVPGRRLLSEIGLHVGAGESVAVMGPSGSGKTSLLNCLCGISVPSTGSVSVDGAELTGLGAGARSAFRLRCIGMVFQFGELLPELSAVENVALPLRLAGMRRVEALRRSREWLDRLDLAGSEAASPDRLSGGEVQRVGIARALAGGPSLVLADEPTGALDEGSSMKIAGLLVETARESGAAVVVATHDPLVASAVGRVMGLRNCSLIPVDAPADPAGAC